MKSYRKVLVLGMFGGGNIGDEAVCRAATSLCARVFGEHCTVSILSSSPEVSQVMSGFVGEIHEYVFPRLRFWTQFIRFVRMLRNQELVVVGGGGLLQDVHGQRLMSSTLFVVALSMIFGCPVVFLGLGVGPVKSSFLRGLGKRIFSRLPGVVCVRDEHSYRYLIDVIGVEEKCVTLTGDTVPLMVDFREVIPKPRSGAVFIFRDWPSLDISGLKLLVKEAINQYGSVEFLAFEEIDVTFYEGLISQDWVDHARISRPKDVSDALRVIESAEWVFSMRLHGCVFAEMLGVDYTAFEYDRKVGEFCRLVKKNVGLLDCGEIGSALDDCFVASSSDASDMMAKCKINENLLSGDIALGGKSVILFLDMLWLILWGVWSGVQRNMKWQMNK